MVSVDLEVADSSAEQWFALSQNVDDILASRKPEGEEIKRSFGKEGW